MVTTSRYKDCGLGCVFLRNGAARAGPRLSRHWQSAGLLAVVTSEHPGRRRRGRAVKQAASKAKRAYAQTGRTPRPRSEHGLEKRRLEVPLSLHRRAPGVLGERGKTRAALERLRMASASAVDTCGTAVRTVAI